jgi:6-phosphogluconolactonase
VVDSTRHVELVGTFHGRERMTLTPPVVNEARARMVLTVGSAKAEMVRRWLLRDAALPIDRVSRRAMVVFLDPAAAAQLPL